MPAATLPRSWRFVAALIVAIGLAWPGAARAGSDFQVTDYITGPQFSASVTPVGDGSFVVVWSGEGPSDVNGVSARAWSAAGIPGPEFRVNDYTTGPQQHPRAAMVGGDLVVVWSGLDGHDGDEGGVFGRRYDLLGNPLGAEFQVNTYTTGRQWTPVIASSPTGGFVVVWNGARGEGRGSEIVGQRYDAAGVPQGGEFIVNSYTTADQYFGQVAMDDSGRFVVVWTGPRNDEEDLGIFGQRYDASGVPEGGEFRVNSYTSGLQYTPSVADDGTGNFVVAWGSGGRYGGVPGPDGSARGVFARRFDAAGTPQGLEFQVNTYTTGPQVQPHVARDGQGNFVVAWQSDGQAGLNSLDAFARRFKADGTGRGPDFQVNQRSPGSHQDVSLGVAADGALFVTWSDDFEQGSHGIYGRQIPQLIFDDGFESGTLAPWSRAATDGGDLSVSEAAALEGTTGLQGVVDDTAGLYVQDDSPEDEVEYHARFSFDPNGFDPGEADGRHRTRIFIAAEEPQRRLLTVVLRRISGQYSLMGRARRDDNSQADTGFFAISDAPHVVEVAWTRSSTLDASDGNFELWIDDALVSSLTGLDNHASAVDFARLGALRKKAGAAGTMYWDTFGSRRASYVDP